MKQKANYSKAGWLIAFLIILVGANLRTALTIMPPILTNISQTFRLPSSLMGSLTTIPLLCFAIISPFVNHFAVKIGILSLIAVALTGLLIGTFIRVFSGVFLLVGTILIGASIAILNVLAPALVASFYPQKIGLMTSAYTLSMTLFSALSAGLSAPVASIIGWKTMLQWLVIFPILPLLIELKVRPRKISQRNLDTATMANDQSTTLQSVWRRPLAWFLTVFMGIQSLLFYTILTWLPSIFLAHGLSQNQASLLLGLLQLSSLPMAYLIPNLAGRRTRQQPLMFMIFGLFVIGLASLLWPTASLLVAIVSCVLLGFATNAAFSISMILFSLKTRNPFETSAVSGMAQSIGYLIAALGPVLAGVIHNLFHTWTVVVVIMLILTCVLMVSGLLIDRKHFVFNH